MWKISKDFSFCYGHRVWTQKLMAAYCEKGDASCKCKHLHGHEGLVRVHLSADKLENNMVTDFKHLGWLKTFLDDILDHKFVIDKNDPMFKIMVEEMYATATGFKLDLIERKITGDVFGWSVNTTGIKGELLETLEGYFVVDFVPTSENLSKWLFNIVEAKMAPLGVKVDSVEWWETPKSCSVYYGESK